MTSQIEFICKDKKLVLDKDKVKIEGPFLDDTMQIDVVVKKNEKDVIDFFKRMEDTFCEIKSEKLEGMCHIYDVKISKKGENYEITFSLSEI